MIANAAKAIIRAFKSGREERDALVSVEIFLVCRPTTKPETEGSKTHGHNMDDRLRGIGEDGSGPGQQVGSAFSHQHQDAEDQREANGKARRVAAALELCHSRK